MLFLDILSSNIYYIYIILILYWVSEYISKIWIGNDINLFFLQNLPYLLSYCLFAESCRVGPESFPSRRVTCQPSLCRVRVVQHWWRVSLDSSKREVAPDPFTV